MSVSLAEKPAKRKPKTRKAKVFVPESLNPFNPDRVTYNAYMTDPSGHKVSVNITPEAAAVWTRYGFKVEFLPGVTK